MHLGDLGFIAAFIILPILIVILCVSALRSLGRRSAAPPPAAPEPEDTQPTDVLPAPSRDWAATVRPSRGRAHTQTEARTFRPPAYRGRSGGAVRRVDTTAVRRTRDSGPPES
ncbi:MAG TPA: hypothetical protein VFI42_06430 [Thermomicrobiaceae bacterium]|nr:hypothetical protein [Thermomicrobiaceae bacterium]